MTTNKLPELPDPAVHWPEALPLRDGGAVSAASYYTAEQMRAYALSALASAPASSAELPSIESLVANLGTEDAVFSAWRNTVPDKHWVTKDLSALRIGYMLGRASLASAPPSPKQQEIPHDDDQ
jgi:hypothetical protein